MFHRRRRRGSHLVLTILATALCAATLAGRAGQAPPQDRPLPTFRTDANYVRVDVYATARDGATVGDLRREEFQLLEDRVPQTIDQFSPVVIRAAGGSPVRADPRTPEESQQAAADARARLFVVFLDVMHVDGTASQTIARPLVEALRRMIGPDDLVAIAGPQIPVRTMTFTRQVDTIERALRGKWGRRDEVDFGDDVERRYAECYPGVPRPGETVAPDLGIAQEMILRRREAQTFDALEALVTYLRDVREERKAVITITNGWGVYRSNPALSRQIRDEVPSAARVAVDPRTGKLSTDATITGDRGGVCEADRLRLAQLDHARRFREMLDRANRANVSFYPVDPRGIVAFDDDIMPVAGVGQNPQIRLADDRSRLGDRHTALRTMAEQTDGVAVIDTNSFAPALQRMATDLSAYYLLGYYSTGRLDGRFHAITVRVTQPGVQIRARRGYLAATTVAVAPAAAISASAAAEAQAVTAALASLGAGARDPAMYVQAAVNWTSASLPSVSAVVEIPRAALTSEWARGGETDLLLIDGSGGTAGSGRVTIAPGTGSARLALAPRSLPPGTYELRVRSKSAATAAVSNHSVRVVVPASPEGSGALFFRRGPATGNLETVTADLRFRRGDTVRVVVPAPPST